MTLVIELGSEQEARLLQAAATAGIDAGEYLRRLIELHVPPQTATPPLNRASTPEARAMAFRTWAEEHRSDTPLLSDEAVSRESMYGDHE